MRVSTGNIELVTENANNILIIGGEADIARNIAFNAMRSAVIVAALLYFVFQRFKRRLDFSGARCHCEAAGSRFRKPADSEPLKVFRSADLPVFEERRRAGCHDAVAPIPYGVPVYFGESIAVSDVDVNIELVKESLSSARIDWKSKQVTYICC